MMEPSFIERDFEAIKARLMAKSDIDPADPEFVLLTQVAYELYILRCNVQSACLKNLLRWTGFPVADYLGELRGCKRAEGESDADYIARIPESMNEFAVCGPEDSYEVLAKKVSSNIIDVNTFCPLRADGTPAGIVEVYVLTDNYWTAEQLAEEIALPEEEKTKVAGVNLEVIMQDLLDAVEAALTPKTARPQCEKIEVYYPSVITADYTVSVTAKKDAAPDLEATLQGLADAYALRVKNVISKDVVVSQIIEELKYRGNHKSVVAPETDTKAGHNEFIDATVTVIITGVTVEK